MAMIHKQTVKRPTIVNLKKDKPPRYLVNIGDAFIKWGEVNEQFPYEVVKTVRQSVTGMACSNTFAQYLYGNGFNNKTLAKYFDSSLSEVSRQMTLLNGFAFKLWFNLEGNIVKFEVIPFENCRLGLPDEKGDVNYIVYNQNFGNPAAYSLTDNIVYPLYDFTAESFYRGVEMHPNKPFIYWYGKESEFARFYPLPFYWGSSDSAGGGYEAMLADYLLSKLLTKELNTGFLQNVILNMVGDENAPATYEDAESMNNGKGYTTAGEALQQYLNDTFSGVDGESMLVFWSKVKEQMPELLPFDSNFKYDKLKDVVETVRTQVATAWRVPSILANIQTSGTLSKDDIRSAAQLMFGVVRPFQQEIERFYVKLIANLSRTTPELLGLDTEVRIENYNPFPDVAKVEPFIWEVLTAEEKRNWIAQNTTIELLEAAKTDGSGMPIQSSNDTLTNLTGKQFQGIQRIVRKFNKGEITFEQAAQLLKAGFNLSDEDIEVWLKQDDDDLNDIDKILNKAKRFLNKFKKW